MTTASPSVLEPHVGECWRLRRELWSRLNGAPVRHWRIVQKTSTSVAIERDDGVQVTRVTSVALWLETFERCDEHTQEVGHVS